jgi:hypothetical protein
MFLQTSVNNLYRLTSNLANDDYLFYEGFWYEQITYFPGPNLQF